MSDATQSYVRIERPEPIVRADSVAHVVFERRDVDSMSRFLVDFGLIAGGTRDNVRYFRGCDDRSYCVAIVPSNVDRLASIAFEARDASDLDRLAQATHWSEEVFGRGATICRTRCARSSPFASCGRC